MKKGLLTATLVVFGAITAIAVWNHGYIGILAFQFSTWAGVQVLVDLVIAVAIFLFWMFPDAKANGRNPWPYLVISLLGGAFGALFYFLLEKRPATAA